MTALVQLIIETVRTVCIAWFCAFSFTSTLYINIHTYNREWLYRCKYRGSHEIHLPLLTLLFLRGILIHIILCLLSRSATSNKKLKKKVKQFFRAADSSGKWNECSLMHFCKTAINTFRWMFTKSDRVLIRTLCHPDPSGWPCALSLFFLYHYLHLFFIKVIDYFLSTWLQPTSVLLIMNHKLLTLSCSPVPAHSLQNCEWLGINLSLCMCWFVNRSVVRMIEIAFID